MSEYLFGTGTGRVPAARSKQIAAIAAPYGATFVATYVPGDGPRYWFVAPNRGRPFDGDLADSVIAALEAAGLWPVCP